MLRAIADKLISDCILINFCTLTPFRTEEHFTAGNVLFCSAASTFLVEELPVLTFPTGRRRVDIKCPTGIAITYRREAELAKAGLMHLSHWK